jgi:HK97 gp10 family phage protein
MPYSVQVEGMKEISDMLAKLGDKSTAAAASGLYDGAGVMAGEIQQKAGSINTAPFHYAVFITREPSPEEKEIVQQGIGIAKFNKNGSEVNTSVGYGNAGYAMLAGKQKAVAQIANAINSGTSFMKKQPFVRNAVASARRKSEEAIVKTIEAKFNEIINNK